jgi:hypothetical protein
LKIRIFKEYLKSKKVFCEKIKMQIVKMMNIKQKIKELFSNINEQSSIME